MPTQAKEGAAEPTVKVMAGRFELILDARCPYSNRLTDLKGFGKATVEKLNSRGIEGKKDLLSLFPRLYRKTYRWFSGVHIVGYRWEFVEFFAEVVGVTHPQSGSRAPVTVKLDVDGARIELLWFNMQRANFLQRLAPGMILQVEGKLDHTRYTPQMMHPTIKVVKDKVRHPPTIELVPVYPGFEGITPAKLQQGIEQAAKELLPHAKDIVPKYLRDLHRLPTIVESFRYLHLLNESFEQDTSIAQFFDFVPKEIQNQLNEARESRSTKGTVPQSKRSNDNDFLDSRYDASQAGVDDHETIDEKEFRNQLKRARERLVYEEFYTLQTRLIRDYMESRKARRALKCSDCRGIDAFIAQLPFSLTNDQKAALQIIKGDMSQSVPMRRLLQGDVGSGKTVVAFAATMHAVANGGQVAFMAPTDVLAKQHLRRAESFFKGMGVRLGLLTGTMPVGERREVLKRVRRNEIDLLIGTHALFQEMVTFASEDCREMSEEMLPGFAEAMQPLDPIDESEITTDSIARQKAPSPLPKVGETLDLFASESAETLDLFAPETQYHLEKIGAKREELSQEVVKKELVEDAEPPKPTGTYNGLALVIVDEQHKFGVEQREKLLAKGRDPHLLAMTATPIPRSLAHAFYGDLDLVVIREKPPGRKPIKTYLRDFRAKPKMYAYIKEEVKKRGIQVYVVFPLVEYSEKLPDRPNLMDGAEELANGDLQGLRIGILHGRMSGDEKNAVMEKFASHELDVLCSTTVIEVGVDVANATIMIIDGAENFGLSQLHQLRGRVGRGDATSMCVLITSSGLKEDTVRRLVTFTQTDDGFALAEEDLRMRGPGEFLGLRQTGVSEFRFGDILRDEEILERARRDVRRELFGDVAE